MSLQPVKVYGSNISYFTGKLENYFHLKGIEYEFHSMRLPADFLTAKRETGVEQMPIIQLADGRWMTDTTKIIQWFEQEFSENAVVPADPLQAFFCYLLEDYADEWLWRPAMHYRWYYHHSALQQSRHLVMELMSEIPLPGALKRWNLRRRQRGGYARGDGIGPDAVAGVEAIYLRTLQHLQAIFEKRPYLLGGHPSLADVGFSGPFFRHFGLDPVPVEIMRKQAPAVFEWMARLWNHGPLGDALSASGALPDDLGPLLDEIGQHYLPYLCANVDAVAAGKKHFDADIAGVPYRGARYSRYRVWCLQELRERFEELPAEAQDTARSLLEKHGIWEPLWRQQELPLLPGQEQGLPFSASTKMVGVNE